MRQLPAFATAAASPSSWLAVAACSAVSASGSWLSPVTLLSIYIQTQSSC